MLGEVATHFSVSEKEILRKVRRITEVEMLSEHSIDIVFSHSVLEHVIEPVPLFRNLYGKLSEPGTMVHVVDYRDHFFKYPYHLEVVHHEQKGGVVVRRVSELDCHRGSNAILMVLKKLQSIFLAIFLSTSPCWMLLDAQ